MPAATKTAVNTFESTLNFTNSNDCKTRDEIIAFTHFDCRNASNIGKNVSITFTQMYDKNLILGSSTTVEPIIRREDTLKNQMHSMRLIYKCESEYISNWMIEGSDVHLSYNESERNVLKTNNSTCQEVPTDQLNQTYAENSYFNKTT